VPADLLLTAHGSRDPAAAPALEQLRVTVATLLPDVVVDLAWIEFGTPLLADVLAARAADPVPPVIVPLLLARGTHLVRDLPAGAHVTAPLGPDRLLTTVLIDRARAAGAQAGQPLVLAATGSRDPDGRADVVRQAGWLQEAWRAPVDVGFVTAEPSVGAAVAALEARTGRTPAVVGYFLAPGRLPTASGAGTAPLSAHPLTAQIVVNRYAMGQKE
jgi:sirohydrochlorin ferrochelatase